MGPLICLCLQKDRPELEMLLQLGNAAVLMKLEVLNVNSFKGRWIGLRDILRSSLVTF
jgi:hypothetical protein